jgi:hypothetical protein
LPPFPGRLGLSPRVPIFNGHRRTETGVATNDQRIGRYVRLEPIGRGAMGVVYRAQDPLIHRTVAIKVLLPSKGLEPEELFVVRERFRREAQAAGGIDHPHIVRILDVGEDTESGDLYIVMEHLPGPNLESMIRESRLDVRQSVEIIGQVAAGLDAAHERQIVHRDVKPSNILFTDRGDAKIVDFGITQIASSSLTQDISQLGTPAYMSPEQVSGKPIDMRADLFSLGVLSYEMLTGARPFTGPDVMSLAYAITHAEPTPISKANPELPAELDRVFALMMAKDPADRFTSGKVFHEAIVRCLDEQAASARPKRVDAGTRSRRAVWATLGAAALCAVALLAFSDGTPTAPVPQNTPEPARAAAPAPAPPRATSPSRPTPPAKSRAAATAPKPVVATANATISLTHRIREGTLIISMDGVSIFKERFSKEKLALLQTTTWDPFLIAAGRHTLRAQVIAAGGAVYSSDDLPVHLEKSQDAELRIKFKGDRLVIQ